LGAQKFVDPVSDIFESMQVVSVVQARLELSAPWGLKRIVENKDAAASAALRYAHFGLLTRGNCWLNVKGQADAIPLSVGDFFLVAPGIAYALRDTPRRPIRDFCELARRKEGHVIRYGGDGAMTTIVSGWFQFCGTSLKQLVRLLPPFILIRADQPQTAALHTTMTMLAAEVATPAPGSFLAVRRLADLLFVQCLRAYAASRSEECEQGLLRAFFDPQIGTVLQHMHEKIEAPWTVDTLASACSMSRSAFAMRFKEKVGETPLEYLTTWRMQKAAVMLQRSDRKLNEVARAVGYASDAAFSKAFKRVAHVSPREFRIRAGSFEEPLTAP
jgi:AraC-like DNA-binding protein